MDGERVVFFRTKIFHAFRKDLTGILGKNVAKEILYRMGINAGRTAFEPQAQVWRSMPEEQFWQHGNTLSEARGWGHIKHHTKESYDGKLRFTIVFEDSGFTDGIAAAEPVCDIVRGAFAAWLSGQFQMRIVNATEVQCKATGASHCMFEVELQPRPLADDVSR